MLVAGAASLIGCTDDSSWSAPAGTGDAAAPGEVQLLLALDAGSATVSDDGEEQSITLRETSDVLAFTDRPVRAAQRTSVDQLVQRWDRLFGDDPPNAALSGVTVDGYSVDVPVELTSISATGDDVSFTARRLDDGQNAPVPEELERVSMFIDDGSPCGGVEGEGAQSLCTTELVYASTFVPFDSSF
jgi:hypothetical protein